MFLFLGFSTETSEFPPLLGVLLLFNHRPSPRENHSVTQPKRRWRTKTKRDGDAVVECQRGCQSENDSDGVHPRPILSLASNSTPHRHQRGQAIDWASSETESKDQDMAPKTAPPRSGGVGSVPDSGNPKVPVPATIQFDVSGGRHAIELHCITVEDISSDNHGPAFGGDVVHRMMTADRGNRSSSAIRSQKHKQR